MFSVEISASFEGVVCHTFNAPEIDTADTARRELQIPNNGQGIDQFLPKNEKWLQSHNTNQIRIRYCTPRKCMYHDLFHLRSYLVDLRLIR
jgi:hypothetical protein